VRRILLAVLLVASLGLPVGTGPAADVAASSGFSEEIVFTGLVRPTSLAFARDGRIFIAEKGGRIKVFDSLTDTTATIFADLSTNVFDHHDRGLLGLALSPNFPADPWVYVLYTYDAPPGGLAPVYRDDCAAVGGDSSGRCVVTARLSKLQASGDTTVGSERVIIHDWCQQYLSHSIGDLRFGADGMLYVSSGDGASYVYVDYGQLPVGGPVNPCGDPPGGAMDPPGAEGGALRSQDLRTPGDPTGLNGTVLRLDPETGEAAPGNPLISSPDPNAQRVVAQGLRNPFRFTMRPGTNELWLGDVGWGIYEEINRLPDPTAGVRNFGWPCYEGNPKQPGYDGADLTVCENLYSGPGQAAPYYTFAHAAAIQGCDRGSSAVTGVAFYPTTGAAYPAEYRGALFFADYARNCIWAMTPATPGGDPSPSRVTEVVGGAANPVDLEIGPGDELYYVDHLGGSVRRLRYFTTNLPPTAVIDATPIGGPAPLTVRFSGAGSTDPDPADSQLTYLWDFTSDGTVDATGPTATHTYATVGRYTATLTVRDSLGVTGSTTVLINPGNDAPVPSVLTPFATLNWSAGQTVTFSGQATDAQAAGGTLPASALDWELRLRHCVPATSCHTHILQTWTGTASGSFVAPDHEYPSYLELALTAEDSGGLRGTVVRRLDPATVDVTFASDPPGLQVTVGATTQTTPFTRTLIKGSTATVSAPAAQTSGATTYHFTGWSDRAARTHVMSPPAAATTLIASYACDAYGYRCGTTPAAFRPADQTVLPLTGRHAVQQITLPFPVRLYGKEYSTAWVDTSGVLSFAPLAGSASDQSPIPSPAATGRADLALYPFWEDLTVDAAASIRTAVVGTPGTRHRAFVVEWRNVAFTAAPAKRVTFEVVIDELGRILFAYRDIAEGDWLERGGGATVGIENATGTVAAQFALNQPVLRSGLGVWFTPPWLVPATSRIGRN